MRRLLFALLAVVLSGSAWATPKYCTVDKTAGMSMSAYIAGMKREGITVKATKGCFSKNSGECGFSFVGVSENGSADHVGCFTGFVTTVVDGKDLADNRDRSFRILKATMKVMEASNDDVYFASDIKDDETTLKTSSNYRYDKRLSCCDVATKETSGGGVVLHFFKKKGYFN